MEEITNEMLFDELKLNTKLVKELIELLKENNKVTDKVHELAEVNLSTSQMMKNFGLGVAQNLVAANIFTGK